MQVNNYRDRIKGTSYCLPELQKTLKLNFLHDIKGILPKIDINLLCSFPPGVIKMVELNYSFFYGKHLTFLSN